MAIKAMEVQVSVPKALYQRLELTARSAKCEVQDVILSALESTLPSLPEHLSREDAAAIARLALLDDETLRTIAETFLAPKQQRRFTTLLHKEEGGRLSAREREEWASLKHAYLRLSHTKAKAQFVLEQRIQRQQAQMHAP